jgi:hypothetical protein
MVESKEKEAIELPLIAMDMVLECLADSLLPMRVVSNDFCQMIDLFRDGKLELDSPLVC